MKVESFSVYPNPFNNEIFISNDMGNIENVRIFDMLGNIVYSGSYSSRINVSNLTSGMYSLEAKTSSGTKIIKIVK